MRQHYYQYFIIVLLSGIYMGCGDLTNNQQTLPENSVDNPAILLPDTEFKFDFNEKTTSYFFKYSQPGGAAECLPYRFLIKGIDGEFEQIRDLNSLAAINPNDVFDTDEFSDDDPLGSIINTLPIPSGDYFFELELSPKGKGTASIKLSPILENDFCNQNFTLARPIDIVTRQEGQIYNNKDVDFYSFETKDTGLIDIKFDFPIDLESVLLTLYDKPEEDPSNILGQIKGVIDGNEAGGQLKAGPVSPSKYYLKFESFEQKTLSENKYGFNVDLDNTSDPLEPNDSYENATLIELGTPLESDLSYFLGIPPVNTDPQSIFQNFFQNFTLNGSDIFKFVVDKPGDVSITISNVTQPGGPNGLNPSYICLSPATDPNACIPLPKLTPTQPDNFFPGILNYKDFLNPGTYFLVIKPIAGRFAPKIKILVKEES